MNIDKHIHISRCVKIMFIIKKISGGVSSIICQGSGVSREDKVKILMRTEGGDRTTGWRTGDRITTDCY